MTRVLVAGSYPPVPGPASRAALATVRRALADGDEVAVVSPRPSAAQFTIAFSGRRGARATRQLGRRVGADTVVLCVEPAWPFDGDAPSPRTRRLAATWARALQAFGQATVIVCGDGAVPGDALRVLLPRVHEVVVDGADAAASVAAAAGLPASRILVRSAGTGERGEIRLPAAEPGRPGPSAVTALGPPEWRKGDRQDAWAARVQAKAARVERGTARVARAVLGDHARKLGPPLRSVVHPLRDRMRGDTR